MASSRRRSKSSGASPSRPASSARRRVETTEIDPHESFTWGVHAEFLDTAGVGPIAGGDAPIDTVRRELQAVRRAFDAGPDPTVDGHAILAELAAPTLAWASPLALEALVRRLPARVARADAGEAITRALGRQLLAQLDESGAPRPALRRLMAIAAGSWCRSAMLLQLRARTDLPPDLAALLHGLHRVLARLGPGPVPFTLGPSPGLTPEWITAVEHVCAPAGLGPLHGAGPTLELAGDDDEAPAPDAAFESEAASVAVLRPDWNDASPRLAVAYHGANLDLDLRVDGESVFAGAWETEIRSGDRRLASVDAWSQVCWHSDAEVDYLELELPLSDSTTLQRQIALARTDRLLFLSDVVLAAESRPLALTSSLPLAPHVSWSPATETREGRLTAGRAVVAIYPLSLPEWRFDRTVGELTVDTDTIRSESRTPVGRAMLSAVVCDLDRKRSSSAATWRPLTVAQDRTAVAVDRAWARRLQIGREQWLLYRSLGPSGNRTVLSHNLISEFLWARFARTGARRPIVEIEPA